MISAFHGFTPWAASLNDFSFSAFSAGFGNEGKGSFFRSPIYDLPAAISHPISVFQRFSVSAFSLIWNGT
jgi:hypothetical protein